MHLVVHSNHSLLEGTATIRQLVGRAVEYGFSSLALTDTDALHGVIPFYQAARGAGLNPLLGARLGPAVLLARDREGYGDLCEVVTAWRLGKVGVGELGAWPFPFGSEHLFILSADRDLARSLAKGGHAPLVVVTHHGDGRSRYRAAGQRAFAEAEGLRAVAVNPVYFLDPPHWELHRVLSAIRTNTTVETLPPDSTAHPGAWFRSRPQMERLYAEWHELLANAAWVAESCGVELELGRPVFPAFPLPPGETAFSWLWKLCFDGLKGRYQPLTPPVIDRVRYELSIIDELGFAPYFLIVADIVRFARESGIPVMGRGSAANSVVAYALGITRVDPMRYDLYFERFMNRSRTDCPDIDLDLCWRRRDEVIDYVYERHGADKVAMICTLNTFQARSALREVAKAHGLSEGEIGRVARLLPHYHAGDIRNVARHIPECRGLRLDEEPLKRIVDMSVRLDGFPRHLSIHAGGVVIAPNRITRHVPLQRAAKGILITQYDMHPIEDLGLVKMDLLGHRSLTVISDSVELIRRNRGMELDPESVADGDALTAGMLREGRTMGCFQIESPAMRGLLRKVAACNTHTLIQCVALVRPGASGSGMKKHFIDRHHGREPVAYPHPAFEAVLGDTYGIMIYQEDVLKVAHAVAGMDLTEADALRRAMSKKRSPREMAKSMKRFLEKARENGVNEDTAQEIWELIANFAAYSYCKAHAATYGEIAYQCAYLKAHFPAEFFAAVLSNRGGFYHPAVYLEEAKRCGIEVRPPCVNRSRRGYTPEDDALRVGLVEVRHLSQAAVDALLESRDAGGPFRDLGECCARAAMTEGDAEALFQAGAFDGFGQPRPAQLWQLKEIYRGVSRAPGEALLFGAHASGGMPVLPDYSLRKRSGLEWAALGLLHDRHPLHYYIARLVERPLIPSPAMASYEGQAATLVGWLVTERRLAVKDGHGAMKFLTLEDTHGAFEAVLFPEAYQRYGHLLTTHGPYVVAGEVQNDANAHALIVDHVERISDAAMEAVCTALGERAPA